VDNLEEIIKGCQKGKASAQKALYELYAPKMFGVCLQYCKDHTEAEDCLQEGFIKVFNNIKKFRSEGSFEGWVRRIMVNTTIESFRKKKPVSSLEDVTMVPVEDAEADEDAELIDAEEVYKIIRELPSKYRMVFNLYALEGLSHKEIAEILDISVGTSKSNLSRARKWIKDKITERIKNKQNAVC
jgi:RNA polymerase sigma-70 factor (ECF subfamily)